MRVMLDTNILYSAILNPTRQFDAVIRKASKRNKLVLCRQVRDELLNAVGEDAPDELENVKRQLREMKPEMVEMPEEPFARLVHIRDETDYPILHVAITKNVDVLVTGDKDFMGTGLKRPKIVRPEEFARDSRYKGKRQRGR
jgi:putative PIN family toxin of toxin-antitoxin system